MVSEKTSSLNSYLEIPRCFRVPFSEPNLHLGRENVQMNLDNFLSIYKLISHMNGKQNLHTCTPFFDKVYSARKKKKKQTILPYK